jgi:phosphonate transport system ATP-binding protein
MNPPLFEVRALSVTYGNGVIALKPTTFEIRPGEFVAVLGKSGAGKSTLLRAMNGLVPATQGEIMIQGGRVAPDQRSLRALRRRVAMVFQQHQLIGRCSALTNVLTGRLSAYPSIRTLFPLPRVDHEIALQSLERVGLLQEALRRCDQLSGGQQQRVGIARAIAQEPQLLLADEPVASLDPATAAEVLTLIKGICESSGISAVVSLHQVDLARRFGTRILGMSGGQLRIDARPRDIDNAELERLYRGSPGPLDLINRQPAPGESVGQRVAA